MIHGTPHEACYIEIPDARAYFDTQRLLAESHGKINHPHRVFFMGHKGDMEVRYSTNKRQLPTDLIEDMRNAFAASVEYLETALRWTISYPRERVVPKER